MNDIKQEPRRRGRPTVSDPLKNTIAIQVTRAMLNAIPKNAKGNPDQDCIREALQAWIDIATRAKIEKESK